MKFEIGFFFVYHNVNTILYVAAELHNNPQNCFSFLCSLIEKKNQQILSFDTHVYAKICKFVICYIILKFWFNMVIRADFITGTIHCAFFQNPE